MTKLESRPWRHDSNYRPSDFPGTIHPGPYEGDRSFGEVTEGKLTVTKQCAFCQIVEDDATKRVTIENDLALVIRDGFPISSGHSLIIPKRHIASFFETSKEEQVALLDLIRQTKSTIDQEFSPDAFNIGINDGPAAGQTVSHLHIHLIPRYQGDVADPRGGVRWVIPDKADYWSQRDD